MNRTYRCICSVPQCESSQLGVVFETLHTDGTRCAGDLQTCDDAHALGGKAWCLLTLAASSLLKLVQQGGDCDLFLSGVNVQNAVETSRQDGLDVQKHDLSLERGDTVNGSLGRAQHETGEDVFFFNTTDTDANLVSACGTRDFIFLLSVQGGDVDRLSVGHHEVLVLLLDDT
jgi:hypothetical protein